MLSSSNVAHTLGTVTDSFWATGRLTLLMLPNIVQKICFAIFILGIVEEQLIFSLLLIFTQQLFLLSLLLI